MTPWEIRRYPVELDPGKELTCICGQPLYESCCDACDGFACPDCGTGCDLDFLPREEGACAHVIAAEEGRRAADPGDEAYRIPTDLDSGWQVQASDGEWVTITRALHFTAPRAVSFFTLETGEQLAAPHDSEAMSRRRPANFPRAGAGAADVACDPACGCVVTAPDACTCIRIWEDLPGEWVQRDPRCPVHGELDEDPPLGGTS